MELSSSATETFEDDKKLVTNAPILSYCDSKTPLVIQCDASDKGLGAALLQEGQHIKIKKNQIKFYLVTRYNLQYVHFIKSDVTEEIL